MQAPTATLSTSKPRRKRNPKPNSSAPAGMQVRMADGTLITDPTVLEPLINPPRVGKRAFNGQLIASAGERNRRRKNCVVTMEKTMQRVRAQCSVHCMMMMFDNNGDVVGAVTTNPEYESVMNAFAGELKLATLQQQMNSVTSQDDDEDEQDFDLDCSPASTSSWSPESAGIKPMAVVQSLSARRAAAAKAQLLKDQRPVELWTPPAQDPVPELTSLMASAASRPWSPPVQDDSDAPGSPIYSIHNDRDLPEAGIPSRKHMSLSLMDEFIACQSDDDEQDEYEEEDEELPFQRTPVVVTKKRICV